MTQLWLFLRRIPTDVYADATVYEAHQIKEEKSEETRDLSDTFSAWNILR